jgi:hypothetical protein
MHRPHSLPLLALFSLLPACASHPGATFATPEEAIQRLAAAADDRAAAEELLGAGHFDLLRSGDEVADRADVEAVRALVDQRVAFDEDGPDRLIALLGEDQWELPLPLVREAGRWRFDVDAGREEIISRRVGRNELLTIATMRALVDAQREYSEMQQAENARAAFAERFLSTEGKRDGLYWPSEEGAPDSPLGPLIAEASDDGYEFEAGEPVPYHGYRFRFLDGQGASAPGGERSYRDDDGRLTRGFGFVAWPAAYRDSGVMTFVVNHRGMVFEKDLGEETPETAAAMNRFDPDASWQPAID